MSGLKSIKKPAVKRTQLFINNEWVNAVGGKTFESINPATEDVICSVSFKFQVFVFFKIIYPRGIGPTYELYSSSRRTAVVPLLKNYMQFF